MEYFGLIYLCNNKKIKFYFILFYSYDKRVLHILIYIRHSIVKTDYYTR